MKKLFYVKDIKEKVSTSTCGRKMVEKGERPSIGFLHFRTTDESDYGKKSVLCYIYLLGIP